MPVFESDCELLRTSHLHEADMLAEALEQAGIPFSRAQESWGGVETAQTTLPAAGGPGLAFLVVVPKNLEQQARRVLDSLPITPGAGFWDFNPAPVVKRGFRVYAWVALAVVAVVVLYQVIKFFLYMVKGS